MRVDYLSRRCHHRLSLLVQIHVLRHKERQNTSRDRRWEPIQHFCSYLSEENLRALSRNSWTTIKRIWKVSRMAVSDTDRRHTMQRVESYNLPFATAIPSVPVTEERKPWYPAEHSPLQVPGTARANIAPDQTHPYGTTEDGYAHGNHNRTVLQQHCDYWDTDGDGVIWPLDTYRGCRRFGYSPPLALIATLVINLGLSYATCPTFLPDPFFRIYLDRIHKAKHGSDSTTYDNEGRYRPQSFEDIFSKYDRGNKGGLTMADVWDFLYGQRLLYDFFGRTAVFAECKSLSVLRTQVKSKLTFGEGSRHTCCYGPKMGS